jgi:hypothetical protein
MWSYIFWKGERRVDNVLVEEVNVVSFRVCGVVIEWEISSQHRVLGSKEDTISENHRTSQV